MVSSVLPIFKDAGHCFSAMTLSLWLKLSDFIFIFSYYLHILYHVMLVVLAAGVKFGYVDRCRLVLTD